MTRTNRILATAALVAAEAALLAAPAFGQAATVYGNETDYDAAAGSSVFTIDFNGSSGSAVAGNSFSAEVTFSSPEASDPTQVLWSSDAITDAGSTISSNGVGPVAGAFAGTATAFKLTFSSASVGESIQLFDESDNLIATVGAPNAAGFFGVVSTTAIKRFVIYPGRTSPFSADRDRFFVDDFSATTSGGGSGGGGGGGEPGGGASDPLSLCRALVAAVEGADPSAFKC